MQLHIGEMRNNNTRILEKIGADTDFNSIKEFFKF
jgi:glucuronate isomerase